MPQKYDLQPYNDPTSKYDIQPYYEGGFLKGLWDLPSELYDTVNTAGKSAAESIKKGDYPAAFRSIAAPVVDPIEGLLQMGVNKIMGKPAMEPMTREQAVLQSAGMAGLPTKGVQEAWQARDYPRLAGQGLAAIGLYAATKKFSGGKAEPTELPPSGGGGAPFPTEPIRPGPLAPSTPEQPGLSFPPARPQHHPLGDIPGLFDEVGHEQQVTPPVTQEPRTITLTKPSTVTVEQFKQAGYRVVDANGEQIIMTRGAEPTTSTPPVTPESPITPEPTPTPTPDVTPTPVPTDLPNVVTIRDPVNELPLWRSRGYVSISGLRSPDGFPQVVRGDLADVYSRARPAAAGAIPEGHVPVGDAPVTESTIPPPPPRKSILKEFFTNDKAEDEITGRFLNWVGQKLGLAEPPTGQEPLDWDILRREWDNLMGNRRPGEETGRVAQFESVNRPPRLGDEGTFDAAVTDLQQETDPGVLREYYKVTKKAIETLTNIKDNTGELPLYKRMHNLVVEKLMDMARNEHELYVKELYEKARALGINPDAYPSVGELAHEIDIRTGKYVPPPSEPVVPETGGIDELGMNSSIREARPGIDMPVEPTMGQQELPWTRGENPQIIDADAITRFRQMAADKFRNAEVPPEQTGFGDELGDDIISNYLHGEDSTPPEMIDLPDQPRRPLGDETGAITTAPLEAIYNKTKEWGWGEGNAPEPPGPPLSKGTKKEPGFIEKAWSLPTAANAIGDFTSAFGRQGLPLIGTLQYWKAIIPAFRSILPSEFKKINQAIKAKPIFQRTKDSAGNIHPSMAEKAGFELIENSADLSKSEQGVAGDWIETGGNIPGLSAAYRATVGKFYTAPSNRMYATFLNHLRANRIESLFENGRNMAIKADKGKWVWPGLHPRKFTPEAAMDLNPYHNLPVAKEIVDFVNTATGRAPLKLKVGYRRNQELNLEFAMGALSKTLFAPRNMFSRMRMLNPLTYLMATPQVRKQYLWSAFSTAAAWFTISKLAEMAGPELGEDVQVSHDLTSADFGKIRIGNTRMDPGGGFQQFLVDYARIWEGGVTSSSTGLFHPYGEGFRAETLRDTQLRFLSNKLNPMVKTLWDLGGASEHIPFQIADRTLQLFTPLIIQDSIELISKDPSLAPFILPAVNFGLGTQSYEKGESAGKLISPENDWSITGGGLKDLFPDLSQY